MPTEALAPAKSRMEFCQRPELFLPHDIEETTVWIMDGSSGYSGPETPMVEVKAKAGPIYDFDGFKRKVAVLSKQSAPAYEHQWLMAAWRPEIGKWTVDHPNN